MNIELSTIYKIPGVRGYMMAESAKRPVGKQ
jgi:hypothetical protein